MESDSVFSVAMSPNSYSLVYFDFVRNMGFIFDHRILAIFAYLFLMLCLVYKPKYYQFDILLSLLIVTTSTSRGGMITYAFIIAAYLFQVYKHKLTLVIGVFMALVVALVIFVNTTSSLPISGFIKSFNPASKDNAINQRGFFADYATKAFLESPIIGNGVGSLSSHLIERDLILEGHKVPAVGDAYWYVLLAEMGAVGFILYLLFLLEVFYSAGILNIALLVGFAIQLIGTDIPDMRFYYFVILVLVYTINRQLKLNITKNLKLRHEN